jgi:hypothetical protein
MDRAALSRVSSDGTPEVASLAHLQHQPKQVHDEGIQHRQAMDGPTAGVVKPKPGDD